MRTAIRDSMGCYVHRSYTSARYYIYGMVDVRAGGAAGPETIIFSQSLILYYVRARETLAWPRAVRRSSLYIDR